jgi:hypothetical protein
MCNTFPHSASSHTAMTIYIRNTDAAIAELEQKRTEIEKTLAELRVINASCRGHLEARRLASGKAP